MLDTSIFIAQEDGRPLGSIPGNSAISVITLAELQLGVLMATDPQIRIQRLRTLASAERLFAPLSIGPDVARIFADIVAQARRQGKRPGIMDTWIAATAIAHDLTLYTQDRGFFDIPEVRVIEV